MDRRSRLIRDVSMGPSGSARRGSNGSWDSNSRQAFGAPLAAIRLIPVTVFDAKVTANRTIIASAFDRRGGATMRLR
jgi:hypothetical protein